MDCGQNIEGINITMYKWDPLNFLCELRVIEEIHNWKFHKPEQE
jgi:hypothetical protein